MKPPAIHKQSRYNHYGGTSPMWSGYPRVFFCHPPVHSSLFPIVSATIITPSLRGRDITKLGSLLACTCMLLCARPIAYRPAMAAYVLQALNHPPKLSLSPCSSVIYHKWALHHAATAPKKDSRAWRVALGAVEPQAILAQQGQHTPLAARWTKGKLTKRLGAALLHCDNFAVLQCRRPPVPVAHLLCRHDSDSAL